MGRLNLRLFLTACCGVPLEALAQTSANRQVAIAEVANAIRTDATATVIAIVLCTVGVGLALYSTLERRRDVDLLLAGLFALLYGVRLLVNGWFIEIGFGGSWLPHAQAILEYIVPIPGALLFNHRFGQRWPKLNRIIVGTFTIVAIVATLYELMMRAPLAAKPLVDVLVIAFILIFGWNLLTTRKSDTPDVRLLRIGAAVFAIFVLNEHLAIVSDPFGLTAEPTGFLFFIGVLVFIVMRDSVRARERLVLVDAEMSAARTIQQSILPRGIPDLVRLDVATVYEPASDVAGDFYDVVEIGDDEVGLFIADVSGHGVPAALVASMLKMALSMQQSNLRDPAALLHEMNRQFCGKLSRQFITAAYAYVEPRAGRITISVAGHPAPLLITSSTVTDLSAAGMILGRFPSAKYENLTAGFSVGDCVVMYTDGATEARSESGEMWGEQRLRDVVRLPGSSTQVAARIISSVRQWGRAIDDDLTLVVVRSR